MEAYKGAEGNLHPFLTSKPAVGDYSGKYHNKST
jgi:hypothetical protein